MKYWVQKNAFDFSIPNTSESTKSIEQFISAPPPMTTLLLNLDESSPFIDRLGGLSQWIKVAKCFDILAPGLGGGVVPINSIVEWGQELLCLRQSYFNVRLAAYIAGTGNRARSAALKAVAAGFKKVIFVFEGDRELRPLDLIPDLRRVCFDVDFSIIERKNLTADPILGALLISTIDPVRFKTMIEELAYLNFLTHQSLVIDLFPTQLESSLVLEAKELGMSVVSSTEVIGLFLELLNRRNSTISQY